MNTVDKIPGDKIPGVICSPDSEETVVDDFNETIVNDAPDGITDKRGKSISVAISIAGADNDHHAGQHHKQNYKETGGPSGPEPTRYGDWEKNGRCIDF